jgi:hypothetical protein
MAPKDLLPLPYLLTVHLLRRDTPDDTTGEVPNVAPEPVPPYKYPPWAFGVGVLIVFIACIFFSFACAGINRRLNRKAALKAEFPCLAANMGLVSCLATSTSAAAAAFAMPGHYSSEVGTVPVLERKKKVVDIDFKVVKTKMQELKMPAALPRVLRMLGRKKAGGDRLGIIVEGDIELGKMPSAKGKGLLAPEGEGWMLNKEGVWIWEAGGKKTGRGPKGEEVIVQGFAGRDEEDSIGFVTTEERFENIDVK